MSDLHFGHAKVIEYDGRPYETTDEMDRDLIKRWNSVVRKDDIVWFLGDLSLITNKEYLTGIISKLHGRKRMVMGNHDRRTVDFYREAGFEFVTKYPVLLHSFFVLSHEPIEGVRDGGVFYNIYGHVHNDERYKTETENSFCVSACRHDYKPIEVPAYNRFILEKMNDVSDRVFDYNNRK